MNTKHRAGLHNLALLLDIHCWFFQHRATCGWNFHDIRNLGKAGWCECANVLVLISGVLRSNVDDESVKREFVEHHRTEKGRSRVRKRNEKRGHSTILFHKNTVFSPACRQRRLFSSIKGKKIKICSMFAFSSGGWLLLAIKRKKNAFSLCSWCC